MYLLKVYLLILSPPTPVPRLESWLWSRFKLYLYYSKD